MVLDIIDLIQALVKQGVSIKEDGVIIWTHCKYCDKSGWTSGKQTGCKLIHEPGCFIELAQKWLDNETEINLMRLV